MAGLLPSHVSVVRFWIQRGFVTGGLLRYVLLLALSSLSWGIHGGGGVQRQ